MKILWYVCGALVLFFLQYKMYKTWKEKDTLLFKAKAKSHFLKHEIETSFVPLQPTKKKIGIFIANEYNIEFSELTYFQTIEYLKSNLPQFDECHEFYNEKNVKQKIFQIFKTLNNDFEENLVFIWICDVASYGHRLTYERVLYLQGDILTENELKHEFVKYPKTKFICGFQTRNTFLPELCVQLKNTREEIKPDKREYIQELNEWILKPFQLNYKENKLKKLQIEFYEISDILEKKLEYTIDENELHTNQFIWCLHGENVSRLFVMYLDILGNDCSIDSFSSYLNDQNIFDNMKLKIRLVLLIKLVQNLLILSFILKIPKTK
jgi:hypothetical protein